jgi:hypothetical protein
VVKNNRVGILGVGVFYARLFLLFHDGCFDSNFQSCRHEKKTQDAREARVLKRCVLGKFNMLLLIWQQQV